MYMRNNDGSYDGAMWHSDISVLPRKALTTKTDPLAAIRWISFEPV